MGIPLGYGAIFKVSPVVMLPSADAIVPHDPYAVLRLPDFRRLVSARVLFTLASQIQGVVVGWQIYELTNNPLALGMIGLAEAIPSITVSLYAGHVADSVPRKRIIVPAVLLLFLCSLSLFLLARPTGMALLAHQKVLALPLYVVMLYAVLFVSGIARGFLGPAVFSFMPQLLPDRNLLSNAVTWNTSSWQAAAVLGPAIGGLLFAKQGKAFAYGVDTVLMLSSLLLFISIASRALPTREGERLSLGESVLSGVKFIFGNQIVLAALSLDLFAVLFGGAVVLLPIFARDILHAGPDGLGYLRAAPAVGSVLMAVWLTYSPLRRGAGRKMLWAVAGFGLATIGFALSRNLVLSFFLLFLTGVFDSVSVIVRSTLIHTYTPEYMKGRVSAVNNIFIGSSNEIGAFESGAAAKLMGTVTSVVFGGMMTLLVVAVTAWKANKLRELETGTK